VPAPLVAPDLIRGLRSAPFVRCARPNSEHGLRVARPRRPHAPELDCGRALQARSARWGKDFTAVLGADR
jgi:hypothetical protein